MVAVVTDAELAELHSMYPLAGIEAGYTAQQEQFMLNLMRGLSTSAASRASGLTSETGGKLLRLEKIQRALDMLREKHFSEALITRDQLNSMLLEAHDGAATSTEQVNAIRELGKMNGLYESDKQRGRPLVEINLGEKIRNVKQIEKLDDEALMKLAGEVITLSPDDYETVDGE